MTKSEQTKQEKQSEKRLLEFLDMVIDQIRKAKTDYAAGRDLTGNFKQLELDLVGMANGIAERKSNISENCATCSNLKCFSKLGSYGDLIRNVCDKWQ